MTLRQQSAALALTKAISVHIPNARHDAGLVVLQALRRDGWQLHRPCPGCCNCTPSNFTDPKCMGDGQLNDEMLAKFHGANV